MHRELMIASSRCRPTCRASCVSSTSSAVKVASSTTEALRDIAGGANPDRLDVDVHGSGCRHRSTSLQHDADVGRGSRTELLVLEVLHVRNVPDEPGEAVERR